MHESLTYILPALSSLLGGGLIVGLLRLKPERESLTSEANERAVRSLISSMDELEERLEHAQKREARLLREMSELREEMRVLRAELHSRKTELVSLQLERDAWKQRAIQCGWTDSPPPPDPVRDE